MNTNAKHSPGPWRIGDAGNTVFGPPAGLPPVRIADLARTQNRIANARMVAAAPDLLYALKEAKLMLETAKAYFPKSIKNRDRFSLLNVLANAVDPAIAKAEGGAQ